MHTWRSRAGLAAIIGTAAVLGASSASAQAALVVTNVVDLPPGTNPGRIAVDESNGSVYVADGGNKVLGFSADLGTSLPDIATGSGAFGLAIDHRAGSHRLFVTLYPGAVEVHALPTGATLCSYGGTGAGLNAVAFNPGTEKAYVAAEVPPNIAVSAGAGNCSITSNVFTHDKPLDVAIDRSANRVYGPIHHANELAVIDGATDTLLNQIPVLAGNPFGVAVDNVHHRVYVAQNLGNQIVDVDSGPTGQGPYSQTNLAVGDAPASIEVDAGLDTAYVGIRNFLQLGVVTHDVVQSPISLGFIPGKPAVNPASHCVYVAGSLGADRKLARLCPNSFSDQVTADGPGWWYRLGEGSGTTMTASAGGKNGNYQNGVVLGQPGALAGDSNTAGLFNGTAAYGYVNGIAAPTQAYTMEIWMKAQAPLQKGTLMDHGGGGALYIETNRFCFRQSQTHICWPSAPTTGDWYHVAGSWDAVSGTARLYVNGTERASGQAPTAPSGSGTFYIGYGQSAPWFKGLLDEAVYYPTRLGADRIASHYHAGCGC
ncbi:MAG: hypothetical protein QOI48_510 [Solirubrobacteraceae bacterium]|jgi:DNA-binding beta-propeller fold protein YncE|nr:hypothetical protein [Solirubrobacteraceae bacterium]